MTPILSGINALGVSTVFLTAVLLLTLPDVFVTLLDVSIDSNWTHIYRSHVVGANLSPVKSCFSMICAPVVLVGQHMAELMTDRVAELLLVGHQFIREAYRARVENGVAKVIGNPLFPDDFDAAGESRKLSSSRLFVELTD